MSNSGQYNRFSQFSGATGTPRRELNADLFGGSAGGSANGTEIVNPLLPLEASILEVRKDVQGFKDQISQLVRQVNEALGSLHQKLESSHQLAQKNEQDKDLLKLELAQKFHQTQVRLGEFEGIEEKVQDMMDRHNTMIKTFEVRIQQLQKLVAEKDAQVAAAQAALNSTIMDLARMRRD